MYSVCDIIHRASRRDTTVQKFRTLLVLSDMETADNGGKKLWRPSWNGVIITLFVGSNIILIRIIGALVYKGRFTENEISQCKQLWMNITQPSAGSRGLEAPPAYVSTGCVVCPEDWLRHREICYYFSSGREYRTWNESREVCEEMGAHLLVIEDREQQEFINRFSKGQEFDVFWIGLYRDGDGWRWVDGVNYDTDLFHLSGSSGDCVWLGASSGYNNDRCQYKHSWICQRRALKI